MKKFLVLSFGLSISSTLLANAPFDISVVQNRNTKNTEVHIVSNSDLLLIKEVVVNRGKCTPRLDPRYSNKLDFSDKTIYWVKDCALDRVREVVINSNQGNYSFSVR